MNSDWAGLPNELVDLILQRLASVSNYFRFGATCTAWHDVATENINYLLSLKHPMLIVPLNAQDVWNLYSIKDNKLLPLPFQVPYVDRFVDSSNGWLVTMDDYLVVRLLNPLCLVPEKQIGCDPNTYITLPPLDPPYSNFDHIRKVVLSTNPISSPDDYMIMAIFGADHHVAYIKPSKDKKWTYINHNWGVLHDLIYFQYHFCAVDHKGEDLKLDSERWEWREMKSIENCVLFVGDNSSLSVVASDFYGCQLNCIYVIDDYEAFLYASMTPNGSCVLKSTKNMGVYNMETRSFTPYDTTKDDVLLADTTKLGIVPSFVAYKPA
ncbi:hypothetical protein PVK06_032621 [Gossypium arboreum]|uniref:KIB1-4 beta-propeller domain-containing protein n=1 Tax=Gossypium arboreum TaxID=29729 RepID=A0ABR0NWS0_GOSAR|nr:hypothetical protein PVK06_032621 [Gossypium arboreum]